MTLTWHIIKKDFRRFWPLVLVLLTVFVVESLIGARLLYHQGEFDFELFSQSRDYAQIAAVLQVLLTGLLVSGIVHEDGFVGTNRAWMTRPISNARLIASKLAGIAILFCILPGLVTLPWWVSAGFGLGEAGTAFWAIFVRQGITALCILPFALITPNLSRFLLALFGCFLALLASAYFLGTLAHEVPRASQLAVTELRIAVTGWVVLGTSLLIIILYTQCRHLSRAVTLLATAFAIVVSLNLWWVPASPVRDGSLEAMERRTGVDVKPHSVASVTSRNPNSRGYELTLEVNGIPKDLVIDAMSNAGQRWFWPDAEHFTPITGPFAVESGTVPQARELLGLGQFEEDTIYTQRLRYRVMIQPSIRDRFATEPSSLELSGQFRLLRPAVFGEVPLREGEVLDSGHHRVRIAQTVSEGESPRVLVVESSASPALTPLRIDVSMHEWENPSAALLTHYLVNRRSGVVREARASRSRTRGIFISGVHVRWRQLEFVTKNPNEPSPSAAHTPENDFTFVTIVAHEITKFEQPVLFPSTWFEAHDAPRSP